MYSASSFATRERRAPGVLPGRPEEAQARRAGDTSLVDRASPVVGHRARRSTRRVLPADRRPPRDRQRRHRDDRRRDPSRPFGRCARTTSRPSRCTTTCSTNGLGSSTCTTGPRAWSQSRPAAPAGFHSSARNCPSRDQPLTDAPLRRTIGVTRVRQVVVALSRDVAPGYVGPRSQAQSDHAPASTASSRGSAFGWRWTSRPRDYLPKSRRACTSSWPRH
jgi:hypothetical protein